MVVLVIIGIMSALIIPEMKGTFEDALLRSTGRKLVDVFHLASSRAITLNQAQRIRIDRKRSRYLVESTARAGANGNSPPPVRDVPGGEGELDGRITIEVRMSGEDASAAPDEGPAFVSGTDLGNRKRDAAITFYPDGTADAAEILLRDHDGFRLALRINPTTARVRIIELARE